VRTNVYIKVELEHEKNDDPVQIAEQICRQIRKFYNVRLAELSGVSGEDD